MSWMLLVFVPTLQEAQAALLYAITTASGVLQASHTEKSFGHLSLGEVERHSGGVQSIE